jgi:hypothetical protein
VTLFLPTQQQTYSKENLSALSRPTGKLGTYSTVLALVHTHTGISQRLRRRIRNPLLQIVILLVKVLVVPSIISLKHTELSEMDQLSKIGASRRSLLQ